MQFYVFDCAALKQIQWVYQRVQGDFGDLHFPAAHLCIRSFLLHPSMLCCQNNTPSLCGRKKRKTDKVTERLEVTKLHIYNFLNNYGYFQAEFFFPGKSSQTNCLLHTIHLVINYTGYHKTLQRQKCLRIQRHPAQSHSTVVLVLRTEKG